MDSFSAYLLATDVLESKRILSDCISGDWPNMKQKDREKVLKQLNERAYPVSGGKPKAKNGRMSTKDLKNFIGGALNNVRR
jgi:hypothetical protein